MAPRLAYSRARPVRIAYLVEDGEHANLTLDAIFARSFGHWGGRFSLIVPCESRRPMPSYAAWMEAFDPDVIYSYVDLDKDVVEQLHEKIYPSFLVRHRIYGQQKITARTLRPDLPIYPLTIGTLIPLAAGPMRFEPAQPTRVVDTMGSADDDHFIQDSFGSWLQSMGSSFPAYLREFGHILAVVADNELQPRGAYIRSPDETVNSRVSLLRALYEGRTSTVSSLSAMSAPRFEIEQSTWSEGFNIVVGDSFVDRVVYWNARSLFPKWRDGSWVDLRIPEALIDDPDFLVNLGLFLSRQNRVSQGSGPPIVFIRSCSVPNDRLQTFADAIRGFQVPRIQRFESADACAPISEQLSQMRFASVESPLQQASNVWSETSFEADEIRINPQSPEHLRFAPISLQSPYEGTWAVDLQIERQINYSRYQGERQSWTLPRRLRMTSSFAKDYEIQGPRGQFMKARVSKGGFLTLFTNSGSRLPSVHQPTDQQVFARALMSGRDWNSFQGGPSVEPVNQLCKDVSRSENGRYFWGVLQMFPSLGAANGFLLHEFWRRQFDRLGASSAASDSRVEIVERTIKKRFGHSIINLRDQDELNRVTKIVLQEAEHYRTTVPNMSWLDLERAFREFQDETWRENPAEEGIDEAEWRSLELERFNREVRDLCQIGVLHQGFEHKCERCLHRSWVAIDQVKREITCEICGTAEAAPIGRPWEIRLNEFVREALRKHGILPAFWALSRLWSTGRTGFFFEGPLDIYINQYREEAGGPDTDIDLTVVSDGRVSMCEVKQSARQLRKARDFADTIRHLRPDVGIIAVMEPESPEILDMFARFSEGLRGTGIGVSLLTLSAGDFGDHI
jgi:hypothetical protein